MEESEKVRIAMKAINKNLDYETLLYSDYMYGKEDFIEDVWSYVEDAKEQGLMWFRETYKEYLS